MRNRSRCWIALSALVLVLASCAKKTYKEVPDELVGVWKTSAPKYDDRFFELKKNSITFGTGEGASETFPVTKTEMQPEDGENLYQVYYVATEGDTQQWVFYFPAAGQGSLRLKNQKSIPWNKQS
jgi:hypothetical protein